MKKLLILTAVVMLTAGSVGCRWGWFRRGALFPPVAPGVTVYEPCPPADACGPCDVPALGAYTTGPSNVLPEPGQ
jgi:hypothetical protein